MVYLADLESDFSAIHRVDDVLAMPSRRFCRLAYRLGLYEGVIQYLAAEADKERKAGNGAGDVTTDPMFAGLVEHSTVGRG